MNFARALFPGHRRRAEAEAERLALEVLARARTALRQQPEGPARAARRPRHDPIPGKARAIAKPDSSITSLLCTYPEQAIIVFTVALCMAGMLQTAIH